MLDYTQTPFLTAVLNKKTDKINIVLIQILSKNMLSYYDINELKSDDYIKFFHLANLWWNRCPLIPISLYYKEEFKNFTYCRHHMFSGDYQIVGGFSGVNLKYLSEKRIKRKIIHLD